MWLMTMSQTPCLDPRSAQHPCTACVFPVRSGHSRHSCARHLNLYGIKSWASMSLEVHHEKDLTCVGQNAACWHSSKHTVCILQVVLAVRAASVLLLIGFARSILGVRPWLSASPASLGRYSWVVALLLQQQRV